MQRHIIIHGLRQSTKEMQPEGKIDTVEQKMGMTADQANETMLARGHCHHILNAERNIIDSEYYTQEKYISKTR